MATLTANKYALPSGAAGGGTQDMASGSWGEIAGVLTGPTDGTIDAVTSLRMQVGGVEGMRIDTNKNVLMGKTATGVATNGAEWDEANSRFSSTTSSVGTQASRFAATHATYGGTILLLDSTRTANSGFSFAEYYANGVTDLRFRVNGVGDVTNTNNSYGAISDRDLKENILDTGSKLDRMMKVGIKDFNFIGDDLKQIGVIAQELEKIFPGMVTIGKDKKRSVKYSVFTPLLIKAFQEYVIKTDARLRKAGIK